MKLIVRRRKYAAQQLADDVSESVESDKEASSGDKIAHVRSKEIV